MFPYVVLLAATTMFAKMVIPTANNVIFAEIPHAYAKLFMPTLPTTAANPMSKNQS